MTETAAAERPVDQRRGETVDFVVQHLLQGILRGRFAPGQRLVTRDLTEEIGISRGSLREAFRLMAADGLVELIPNRGAVIRRLSRRQTRDLFQVREALEGMAARLAARNIGERDNRRLFTDMWDQVKPRERYLPWNRFIEHNRSFHHTIVLIGGNAQLHDLIDKLQLPIMMIQIGRTMEQVHIARSEADHEAISAAILAGDPSAAERSMKQHLRGLADWVCQLPDDAFKPEP